ncbi:MAG: hypothetical protein JWM96_307 [Alphaproteobacteria bacterium]|nr:hypothetical protein [Alphaproteobacteria bacterium]
MRTGFGALYLGLLSLVLTLVLGTSVLISVNQFEKTELPHILAQVPPMRMANGEITVEGKQPVTIKSRNKEMTITIDTEKSENELRETKTNIGIGKDFVFLQSGDTYRPLYLKDMEAKDYTLNKDTLQRFAHDNIRVLKFAAFPFLWLGQFINVIVKCFFVALLSYVVTAFMREEYDFLARMRLAALALTAPQLISLVMGLVFNHQTAIWFVFLLSSLYIYVMIVLMRRLGPAPVNEPDVII